MTRSTGLRGGDCRTLQFHSGSLPVKGATASLRDGRGHPWTVGLGALTTHRGGVEAAGASTEPPGRGSPQLLEATMAGDTVMTIVGNLARGPGALRFIPSGAGDALRGPCRDLMIFAWSSSWRTAVSTDVHGAAS